MVVRTEDNKMLTAVQGWVRCECGKKLLHIRYNTLAKNLPQHCRYCKRDYLLDIEI